jgi:hypothetical protein
MTHNSLLRQILMRAMVSFQKHGELVMKVKWLLAASAAVLVMQTPGSAQAFECPMHFAATQAAIDKVAGDMKADIPWQTPLDKELVLTLLDDARMLLGGAKHNHEHPTGGYSHARAIAKADAALGYANAADLFHRELLSQ